MTCWSPSPSQSWVFNTPAYRLAGTYSVPIIRQPTLPLIILLFLNASCKILGGFGVVRASECQCSITNSLLSFRERWLCIPWKETVQELRDYLRCYVDERISIQVRNIANHCLLFFYANHVGRLLLGLQNRRYFLWYEPISPSFKIDSQELWPISKFPLQVVNITNISSLSSSVQCRSFHARS